MSVRTILLPLFAEVLLTFALMLGMMLTRSSALRSGRARFGEIALREPNWPARPTQFAYAFSNQFELPVLFYVLTILEVVTNHASYLLVALAWVFVAARVAQAALHVTANVVPWRGAFYGLGALVLLVMWIDFALRILGGTP